MRKIKHLSYSGFKMFESSPEQFYRVYLAEVRTTRDPQNHYMAIGSAFDAYAKADLYDRFVGDKNPEYHRDTLFEKQVEAHNRDMAKVDGDTVYKMYKASGAYDDLVREMEGCVNPRFEVELAGDVMSGDKTAYLLGKPDVMYISRTGLRVVHDFKVTGFYSKAPKTPNAGYIKSFPKMQMHRNATPGYVKGHLINQAVRFHNHNEEWAQQLSMYAWLLGADVGGEYVLSVDQICCHKESKAVLVAKHAGVCRDTWQKDLFNRVANCWTRALSGHIFQDMTYEDNMNKLKLIDAALESEKPAEFLAVNGTRLR